jgi:hypothetical protein
MVSTEHEMPGTWTHRPRFILFLVGCGEIFLESDEQERSSTLMMNSIGRSSILMMSFGYYGSVSARLLVESGRGTPRRGLSNDRRRDINVDSFLNPNSFAIVDYLPQGDSFTGQYFTDQILKSLGQEYSAKSAEIARRSFRLHFDNSRCHTAKIVSEEMTRLKCKSMPYPLYSPDMAIADFYLLGFLKQKLHGIDISDDEKLKSEILTIFQGIISDELNKSFNH